MLGRLDDAAGWVMTCIGRGHRLAEVLTAAGFVIDAEQHRVDELAVERSPAWTATTMMLASGHATRSDVARWEADANHGPAPRRSAAVLPAAG